MPNASAPELLRIEKLSAGYGEALVLFDIDLALCEGRSLALLGRNGVGKTTLVNTIIGVTRRREGRIVLAGRDITLASPEQRAHAIGYVTGGGVVAAFAGTWLAMLTQNVEGLEAFTAADAARLTEAIIVAVRELVNDLSAQARRDGLCNFGQRGQ